MEPTSPGPHIPEDLLEEYALGRLPAQRVPMVFEHLLACDDCNERYEAELDLKHAVREAMARPVVAAEPRRREWLNMFAMPKPAWAAVAALAVIAAFAPTLLRQTGSVETLELSALRSAEKVPTARSGSAVRLHLVTAGVDVATPVTVQIADDSGREVWQGAATATERNWQVQPDRTFSAGRYWVRVLDPQQPDPPLREYSFVVQ